MLVCGTLKNWDYPRALSWVKDDLKKIMLIKESEDAFITTVKLTFWNSTLFYLHRVLAGYLNVNTELELPEGKLLW